MNKNRLIAFFVVSFTAIAVQAQTDVNVSVGGEIKPGVYGRIEVGTRPPPPVYYPQPVIIAPQPVALVQQPIYMHVPPGHAKKWSKHCYKYNACNQPVYFVKSPSGNHAHAHKGRGKNKHDD